MAFLPNKIFIDTAYIYIYLKYTIQYYHVGERER